MRRRASQTRTGSACGYVGCVVIGSAVLPRAVSGRYKPVDPGAGWDFAVGLSFGGRRTGDKAVVPGPVNEHLARVVAEYAPRLPLVLQREVAEALQHQGHSLVSGPGVHVVRKHRRSGVYLDTREVLAQAVETARQHEWRRPLVFAHPCHLPRVEAELGRFGLAGGPAPGLEVLWDRLSSQTWTRDPWLWAGHEALTWVLYRRTDFRPAVHAAWRLGRNGGA